MKSFLSAFLTAVFAAAVVIGCGLVDENPSSPFNDRPGIDVTYDGFSPARVPPPDTSGWSGGGGP